MKKWLARACAVLLAGWLFVLGLSGDTFLRRTLLHDGGTVTQDYKGFVMFVVSLLLIVLFACYWWLSARSTGRLWPWGVGARLIGDRVEGWRERVSASGGYFAALRITLKAQRKGLVAAACLGFLGVLTYALISRQLSENLLIVFFGAPFSLELIGTAVLFGPHGGGALQHIVAGFCWGLGMQLLWLPYLVITWKRSLAPALRIFLVGVACILMLAFNVFFFLLIGGKAVATM